eukprot:TRINITY_DN12175_c5_g1_i1.p1 TRINITY_DN12175_c5_g1~~TRINITY_DN12175_c5_g1_i1.p1  ORF type:complete len:461 (-),score=65.66 TRINITY_DN12175_c5_g1_i1:12-1394(-)
MPNLYRTALITVEQVDKIRTCHDLSRGEACLNDDIDQDAKTVTYQSLLKARRLINELKAKYGAHRVRLSKFDIKSAYRLLPVWFFDQQLQGFEFEGRVYIDTCLSFGGASAPALFDRFGQVVQDIIQLELDRLCGPGVAMLVRYVDDILMVSVDNITVQAVVCLRVTAERLGVPLKKAKEDIATTRLTFLGIELDVDSHVMRVPVDKRARVTASIQRAIMDGEIDVKELRKLLGRLQFLQQAVPAIKPFQATLWRMVSARRTKASVNRHQMRALRAWLSALDTNEGIPIGRTIRSDTVHVIETDSSGNMGFGAVWRAKRVYVHGRWPKELKARNIKEHNVSGMTSMAFLELVPVLVVFQQWGPLLRDSHVVIKVDNEGTRISVNKMWSKSQEMCALLVELQTLLIKYSATLECVRIATKDNVLADAASRRKFGVLDEAHMAKEPLKDKRVFNLCRDAILL